MAVLPDVSGPRPVPRPSRAIATISPGAAAATGNALQGIGEQVTRVGEVMFDRETTAMATERDTMVSDKIRDLLYNPKTGFASMRGQAAVDARSRTLEQLQALKGQAYEGLNATAKRKLESSLNRRLEGAMGTVERHTLDQRDAWLAGASEARMTSAYQDGLFNLGETDAALSIIENETRAQAIREGWAPEKTSVELEARRSDLIADQVKRIAATDPLAAMEYMRKNEGRMVASDIASLEMTLQPEVKKAIGRRRGADAAKSMPSYQHNTSISYSMGPARPYAPDQPVLDVIGRSVEDVIGPGAKVIVTSGQEGDKPQHGANRHKTGKAADIQIIRQDGSVVKATDPEMAQIAMAAARNGALGVGFGSEYMGGDHIHIDLVEPGAGQANTWSSGGVAIRDEFVGAIRQRQTGQPSEAGYSAILDIEDPIERAAALEEYELRTSVAQGERKAALAAAQDAAFQMIEAGGSLDQLPVDVRQALGQTAMTSLRSYQSTLAKGGEISTDPEVYYDLRRIQANNPAGFANLNLVEYRDRLNDTDLKMFMDAQQNPKQAEAVAINTLMGIGRRVLEAAGIDTSPDSGSHDAGRVARVMHSVSDWQTTFVVENKRPPTQSEIMERFRQEVAPVVLDLSGPLNRRDDLIATDDVELDGDALAELRREDGILSIDGTPLPAFLVRDLQKLIIQSGDPVTVETLTEYYFKLRSQR